MFADDKFDFSYIDNEASNGAWANCWHPSWAQSRTDGQTGERMTAADAKQRRDQRDQQPQSRRNGGTK